MIGGLSVLAIVPARGGSKGVTRKNLRLVAGRPLIAWTIEAARGSRHIDRLVLSSDDDEIIDTARRCGCDAPFRRPDALASDEAGSIDVILHAIETLPEHYDYVALLQPTSPLREAIDIDGAVAACHHHDAPSCVTLCRAEINPRWMFTMDADKRILPIVGGEVPTRRQVAGEVLALNGAVYVARRSFLLETKTFLGDRTVGYVMPRERSLDIDDEFDLKLADLLMSEGR
jgi:CMP-N,N'-diacetyllegionaminic acid synthase